MDRKKITPVDIQAMKNEGKKITMLTAYDYPMALLEDRAGIDIILVGDSGGMTVLGYDNTLPVTMDEMIQLTKAVTRGAKYALIIGDMPFMSYNTSERDAIINAGRFMKEGKADAVKLEDAGAFAVLLEAIPATIAKRITERLKIPTVGIGGGIHCDGQVLVVHDMLGLFDRFTPKFAKRYVNLSELILKAFEAYKEEVLKGDFPTDQHSFHIDEQELSKIKG